VINNPRDISLSSHLKAFISTYLPVHMSLSPNSIKSYCDTFKLLVGFLAVQKDISSPLQVSDLTAPRILKFLQHLEDKTLGRGNSPTTRNVRLAAIQSFFHYVEIYISSQDRLVRQVLAIQKKKAPSKSVNSLTREELEAVLSQPVLSNKDGFRDFAILAFMYNTGARAQEVVDAVDAWFDFGKCAVEIVGKGKTKRTTPLMPYVAKILQIYKEKYRRPTRDGVASFFVNQRGRAFTRFGVRALVKRYVARAAKICPSLVGKKISTHSLRHTTAVHLLAARVEANALKQWLGHKNLRTTSRYLQMDLNHKRRILEKFGVPDNVKSFFEPQAEASAVQLLDWLKNS
jgi:site-specific recombinase XerD